MMIESESNRLFTAAQALLNKIDRVSASPEWSGIWTHAYVHGVIYKGESFSKELEDLRKVLQEIKAKTDA